MKKIIRNLATEESRSFWTRVEEASAEVGTWPDWKRAGINVTQLRSKARLISDGSLLADSPRKSK